MKRIKFEIVEDLTFRRLSYKWMDVSMVQYKRTPNDIHTFQVVNLTVSKMKYDVIEAKMTMSAGVK